MLEQLERSDKDELEELLQALVDMQQDKMLACGREFVAQLTREDALQPIDYPELELNPYFRYEEGILAGMQTVQTFLRAWMRSVAKLAEKAPEPKSVGLCEHSVRLQNL